MKTNNSTLVSLYKNLSDKVGVVAPINKIYEGIRSGRWKEQVELHRSGQIDGKDPFKGTIPCFTVGGVFIGGKSNDNCSIPSGLVSFDFDGVSGAYSLLETLDELGMDIYTHACFKSLSGDGLCVIFKIPTTNSNEEYQRRYRNIYNLIYPHVKDLCKLDSLPNLSRLRFVSSDPDIYTNEGCRTWEGIEPEETEKPKVLVQKSENKLVTDDSELFDIALFNYEQACGVFGGGGKTRHDWVLGLGRYLCRGGVSEEYGISRVIDSFPNPDRAAVWNSEVRRAIKSAYRRYASEQGTYTPVEKFDYGDIEKAVNFEEVLLQVIRYIEEKKGLVEYLKKEGKKTEYVEKEIKFLNNLYRRLI
jgi:hypothetical protein